MLRASEQSDAVRRPSGRAAELVGIVVVDKPPGWTSHDVVARVRRLAGQKRVGHAGTLDPMASGVLPVLLGRATRLMDLVQSGRKTYVAHVLLGSATDTDDAEGTTIATAGVPGLSTELVEAALASFRGDILQTPPPYSALKVAGQRAYDLARRGEPVALASRRVTIETLGLLSHTADTLALEVTCSKGTYIRALARDIAWALGTVGHLAALRRTRVGPFGEADAYTLEEIAARGVDAVRLSPRQADPSAPTFKAAPDQARRLQNGQALSLPEALRGERHWVYDPDGRLLCLASADGTSLRPIVQL